MNMFCLVLSKTTSIHVSCDDGLVEVCWLAGRVEGLDMVLRATVKCLVSESLSEMSS